MMILNKGTVNKKYEFNKKIIERLPILVHDKLVQNISKILNIDPSKSANA